MMSMTKLEQYSYPDGTYFGGVRFVRERYPAKDTFRDSIEYVVVQANGEWHEYEYQRYQYYELKDKTHKVRFIAYALHVVLAPIKLQGIPIENMKTTDHVTFKLRFKADGTGALAEKGYQDCKAVMIEDILDVCGPGEVLFLVVNKSAKKLGGYFTRPGQKTREFDCAVDPIVHPDHIRKGLSAFEKFARCEDDAVWNRLFINMDACVAERNNPSAMLPLNDEHKADILNETILAMKANPQQETAIRDAATSNVCHTSVAKAAAGTGKTTISGALVSYFVEVGAHVVGIASTNAATDKLFQEVYESQQDIANERGIDVPLNHQPFRLHRWQMEKSYASKHGLEDRPEKERDDSNLTDKAKAHRAADEEAWTSSATQFALEIAFYSDARNRDKEKSFSKETTGLAYITLEAAQAKNVVAMGKYSGSAPESASIDMMEELRNFMRDLEQGSPYDWDQDKRKQFSQAFEQSAAKVASDRKALFTTPIMVTRKVVKAFAKDAAAVILIVEEASIPRDMSILINLFEAPWASKIISLILVGDNNQNGTLALSPDARTNPFGDQLRRALMDRLEKSRFPMNTLITQYRSHPILLAFPNHRCYGNLLRTDPSVEKRTGNADLEALMCTYTGVKKIDDARLQHIAIDGSETKISDFTKSRSCLHQAVWIREFLVTALETAAVTESGFNFHEEMVIISPYKDQTRLIAFHCRKAIRYLNEKNGTSLTMENLPVISTGDSYQGRECEFVICSLGISSAHDWSELGFVGDNKRMNMMSTRAKKYLWFVGSHSIPNGNLFRDWEELVEDFVTGLKRLKPMPYIGAYLRYLNAQEREAPFRSPIISPAEWAEYLKFIERTSAPAEQSVSSLHIAVVAHADINHRQTGTSLESQMLSFSRLSLVLIQPAQATSVAMLLLQPGSCYWIRPYPRLMMMPKV
jgi:hypothetical protein